MKYHYRRTTRHTVRLAFELTNPYHNQPQQVWRIRDDHGTRYFRHEGMVLEHSKKRLIRRICGWFLVPEGLLTGGKARFVNARSS